MITHISTPISNARTNTVAGKAQITRPSMASSNGQEVTFAGSSKSHAGFAKRAGLLLGLIATTIAPQAAHAAGPTPPLDGEGRPAAELGPTRQTPASRNEIDVDGCNIFGVGRSLMDCVTDKLLATYPVLSERLTWGTHRNGQVVRGSGLTFLKTMVSLNVVATRQGGGMLNAQRLTSLLNLRESNVSSILERMANEGVLTRGQNGTYIPLELVTFFNAGDFGDNGWANYLRILNESRLQSPAQ